MARPTRYNADYYTHSAHLRNDRRVKAIRTQLGAAGYGLLHMLLEVLTDADFTQLSTKELELELLAGDFGVSVTEIHSLLQIAEKVGFLTRNEAGFLVCPDLNSWLAEVFEKRNRARNAYKQAESTVSVTEIGVSVTENPQSKVKESKEDNNRSASAGESADSSSQNPATTPSQPAEADKPGSVLGAGLNVPFNDFWQAYGKKVGRHKSELKWKALTPAERTAALAALPAYVARKPDLQYRQHPLSWLNGKHWEDELPAEVVPAARPAPTQPAPVGPAPVLAPDLNHEVVAERQARRDAEAAEARRRVRAASLAS